MVLDRTPFTTWGGYGGLALRGAGDWTDTRLLARRRRRARAACSASRRRWCDLTGTVDGGEAGVLAPRPPGQPASPGALVRVARKAATYGDEGWSNFLNAAFLWDEPLPWPAGEPLPFRYRVVVHDGIWDADRVPRAEWDALRAGG